MLLALGGSLSFNPLDDSLTASDGKTFKLAAPESAPDVPDRGFVDAEDVYITPSENPDAVQVLIDQLVKDCKSLNHLVRGWQGLE